MLMYYGRPPEDQILVTFGIGIIMVELVRSIYGGISRSIPTPEWGQGIAHIGSLVYPLYRLQALGIAAATLALLYYVLYRTSLGLIVRAGIEDDQMVNALGINVIRTFLLGFGLGPMADG